MSLLPAHTRLLNHISIPGRGRDRPALPVKHAGKGRGVAPLRASGQVRSGEQEGGGERRERDRKAGHERVGVMKGKGGGGGTRKAKRARE